MKVRLYVFISFLMLFSIAAEDLLKGGLYLDLYPMLSWTSIPEEDRGTIVDAELSADELSAFCNRPALLSFGAVLALKKFKAIIQYEFQQDIWSQAWKHSYTNIPDGPDTWFFSGAVGSFFPLVAYAEWEDTYFRASAGRRKLHSGPGSLSLDISSENPFYDHLTFGLNVPLAGGILGWDYLTVFTQRYINNLSEEISPKYYIMHRASWSGEHFSVGLLNYNLVAGAQPDFQDLSPFIFYHHLFGTNQNVMMGADVSWHFNKDVDIYFQAIIDEFQEAAGSNPSALGLLLGAEWRVLEGVLLERNAYRNSEHTWYITNKPKPAQLKLRLEAALSSVYLYRRFEDFPDEAITARYVITTSWGRESWREVSSPPFSYPIFPDMFVIRASADWNLAKIESFLSLEFRLNGSQTAMQTYDNSAKSAGVQWLFPSDPITPELAISSSCKFFPDTKSIVSADISCSIVPNAFGFSCYLGYGRRLGMGLTPKR